MVQAIIKRFERPFDARDLQVCQAVFDAVRCTAGIDKASKEAERIAAITVELYRQGARKPDQLRPMVEAARGLRVGDRERNPGTPA